MFQLGLLPRHWIRLFSSALLIVGFSVISAMAADVRFTSGNGALKIPFRLYNNHIYLHVSINGSAPLWFLLDTGARNIIASKNAPILGLKVTPAGQAVGNGDTTQDVFTTSDISFTLPGVTVTHEKFAVIDMDAVEECANEIDVDRRGGMVMRERSRQGDERQAFDGVLGDEFLRLFVVEIDYDAQVMNLYEPKSYKYQGRGEIVPLEVRSRYAFLHTQLTSASGSTVNGAFMIDTGHMGALLLHRPFVETNRLLPPEEKTIPFELCGIGGHSKAQLGPLQSLRMGTAEIKEPITLFSQASAGNLTRTDYDGVIGNAALRRFDVVFDYGHSRMYLGPRSKK